MNYSRDSLARTLKDAGCQVFLNTLDKIDGCKDLVLSKTILVQLDSICGMQKLRQNAVDKVFKLQATPVISETKNRVYVIRPWLDEVKLVISQIKEYLNSDDDRLAAFNTKFWIIFVPKLVHYCELEIEEEGIYEYLTLLECPLGLIPLEYDVYSLEDHSIFTSLYRNRDITMISEVVQSIVQIQLLSGIIKDVHGQGRYAKMVADKLDQANLTYGYNLSIKTESGSPRALTRDFRVLSFDETSGNDHQSFEQEPAFTDLYLYDRNCDFASILLSQLNYEGILDEAFSICCNKLEFATKNGNSDDNNFVKHSLSSEHDPVYRDIRDNHFSTVFSLLKTKNHEMKEKYSKSQDMNLSNLKNFVAHELKGLQAEFKSLAIHISACEEIMKERNKYDFGDQLRVEQNIIDGVEIKKCLDYISKMIEHQLNPYVPLRLLSLLSLTQGGLPPRDYSKYLSLYCENYGLFNNVTFSNLKQLGILNEMSLSLNSLTGGLLNYGSSETLPKQQISSSISIASFTGAMSSLTERASGRVAAVVSSSVLPRRGNLSQMLKKFQLVPEIGDTGYNIRDPKDPAFVYGGSYIPLICQLIDNTVLLQKDKKKNTQNIMTPSDLTKLLPGPNFKRKQAHLTDYPTRAASNASEKNNNPQSRSILIYFIGGVTYSEITALRFIAKKRNVRIAVASTCIINGNRLVESAFPSESVRSAQTKRDKQQ